MLYALATAFELLLTIVTSAHEQLYAPITIIQSIDY